MGHGESSSKGQTHSLSILTQEIRKILNNLTLHLKELEEEQAAKSKMRRRKEVVKIVAEMKGKNLKEQYKRSMKRRAGSLKR